MQDLACPGWRSFRLAAGVRRQPTIFGLLPDPRAGIPSAPAHRRPSRGPPPPAGDRRLSPATLPGRQDLPAIVDRGQDTADRRLILRQLIASAVTGHPGPSAISQQLPAAGVPTTVPAWAQVRATVWHSITPVAMSRNVVHAACTFRLQRTARGRHQCPSPVVHRALRVFLRLVEVTLRPGWSTRLGNP